MLDALVLAAWLSVQADPAAQIRELDPRVLPAEQPRMIGRDVRARIEEANRRESEAWGEIKSKTEWEAYRDRKLLALRESLWTKDKVPLTLKTSRTFDGDGFRIENLVFESRPALWVTANLYAPLPERPSMPGILIVHSHHNPKTQSELQDMGMTWARMGCLVLIMDQVGHGERRQHPFVDASSYKGAFKVGRQDYFFRYVTGLQLMLVEESLIGWMAWDLRRGVDLLTIRPGIDKERIILLGSVAGGGDPAAVAAALDPRITAAVPFNFGGPQPESRYPLPEDSETSFNYAGGGSWESTRNLRLSASEGFLPWVIVGSLAPRRLIYGHEFSWDREHDPVWKRLEKIYGFYDATGNLSAATGRGLLSGQPPEASHCNNIGPVHRQGIYPALKKWFNIPEPEKEYQERRPAADLFCAPPDLKLGKVHEMAEDRILPAKLRLDKLKKRWEEVLGNTAPTAELKATEGETKKMESFVVKRTAIEVEAGIVIPLLILLPLHEPGAKFPVVIAVSQGGKKDFLKHRSEEIAALLKGGVAVCLPDLRGTGETRPGDSRGRGSESTSIASTEFMLGRSLLGLRVRDLRSVLAHLRTRTDFDAGRLALWGDSTAPANEPDRIVAVPIDADPQPGLAEPLGGLAALFAAFNEPSVSAVLIRGGLVSYRSLLESPFCYVPYDALVPGGAKLTDLPEVAAGLAPRALRLEGLVDGLNRLVPTKKLGEIYTPAMLEAEGSSMAWLLKQIKD